MQWVRQLFDLSGQFRIHDLRHTAASLMIQAGYPPKMLQEIMGHASITTTLDLYGTSTLVTRTATPTVSTAPQQRLIRPVFPLVGRAWRGFGLLGCAF